MENFPEDILLIIINKLRGISLLTFSRLGKNFNNLAQTLELYKKLPKTVNTEENLKQSINLCDFELIDYFSAKLKDLPISVCELVGKMGNKNIIEYLASRFEMYHWHWSPIAIFAEKSCHTEIEKYCNLKKGTFMESSIRFASRNDHAELINYIIEHINNSDYNQAMRDACRN